jgi:hypothetical protein
VERCVFDCGDLNTCCACVALTCRTVWKQESSFTVLCTGIGFASHLVATIDRPPAWHGFFTTPPWLLGYHPPSAPGFSKDGGRGNKMVTGVVLLYNTHGLGHAPEGTREKGASEGQAQTTHAMGPPPHELTQTHAKKRKLKHGAGCALFTVYSLQTCSAPTAATRPLVQLAGGQCFARDRRHRASSAHRAMKTSLPAASSMSCLAWSSRWLYRTLCDGEITRG